MHRFLSKSNSYSAYSISGSVNFCLKESNANRIVAAVALSLLFPRSFVTDSRLSQGPIGSDVRALAC